MDDAELLREYVCSRSPEVFRELVDRHVGMVYSAAQRMVRDAHLAEEIAQNVFVTFARKAESLAPEQIVGGWLYNTTRHLAMQAVRGEQRRREREQTAVAMQALESNSDAARIADELEPAMAELDAAERDVLVLRYLENRSLREVGAELGISEDAARMRVNRALEQLRTVFDRHGFGITSVALASTLVAATSNAVPAALGGSIVTAALASSVVTAPAVLTTMSWINAKMISAVLGAVMIAGTATYLVQQREINRLRTDRLELLAAQEELRADVAGASAEAQGNRSEVERLQKDTTELLRLRNEVAQLRRQREVTRQVPAQSAPVATTKQNAGGVYLSKGQLAPVGYATPEAALQTINWAMMNGTYSQVLEGLSPDLQASESKDPDGGAEHFAESQKTMAPLFKGMQILAKKILSDDKVELKIRLDADPVPGFPRSPSSHPTSEFSIQPMVKVGNEWRLGGSTRQHEEKWDRDGQVLPVTQ